LAAIAVGRLNVSPVLGKLGADAPTVVFTYLACDAFEMPLNLKESVVIEYIKRERKLRRNH